MAEEKIRPMLEKILPMDDGLHHQTAELMCEMGTGDRNPKWLKHIWTMLVPYGTNAPPIDVVFTKHPNQNLIHGFASVVVDNVQYNIRGCREVSDDMTSISVGPLRLEVIEPWKTTKLLLHENNYAPIHFELELTSTLIPPYSNPKLEFQEEGAPFKSQWRRIFSPVSIKRGYVYVDGRQWAINNYVGMRCEEYGIRAWGAGIGFLYAVFAYIGDEKVVIINEERPWNFGHPELAFGEIVTENGERIKLVKHEDDWVFEKGSRDMISGRISIVDARGTRRELKVKRLSRAIYLGGGWLGESPRDYYGPFHIESDKFDLNDKETLLKLGPQLRDEYVEYVLDGKKGYGVFEFAISRKHPKYGPMLG